MLTEHPRTALVYKKINQPKEQAEVKTRKDAMFLAQICSGHCLSFKAYQLVPDEGKVHTFWNTGSWNALELSQHDKTFLPFLVMRTCRWRFPQMKRERWC